MKAGMHVDIASHKVWKNSRVSPYLLIRFLDKPNFNFFFPKRGFWKIWLQRKNEHDYTGSCGEAVLCPAQCRSASWEVCASAPAHLRRSSAGRPKSSGWLHPAVWRASCELYCKCRKSNYKKQMSQCQTTGSPRRQNCLALAGTQGLFPTLFLAPLRDWEGKHFLISILLFSVKCFYW